MLKKLIFFAVFMSKCFSESLNIPFVSLNVYSIKTNELKNLSLNKNHLSYKEYQIFINTLLNLHPNLIFACQISTLDIVSIPCNFIETISVPKVTKNSNAPDSITPIHVNFNKTITVSKINKEDSFYHAKIILNLAFPIGKPKVNIGQDSLEINQIQHIDITNDYPYNVFIIKYNDHSLQNADQKDQNKNDSILSGYTIIYTYEIN